MSIIVRRSALGFAVASLVLGACAPAFAGLRPAVFTDGSTMKLDAGTGQYCLTETAPTGSHIPVVTCKSREDWAKDGLTISVAK